MLEQQLGIVIAIVLSVFILSVALTAMVIHSHSLDYKESIRRAEIQANTAIEVAKFNQCSCFEDEDEEEGSE